MILLPLSSIQVTENRQRRLFDPEKLQELADDIQAQGLLQPLVVRSSGDAVILVAGERRLRAITQLTELGFRVRCGTTDIPPGQAPVIDLGTLTPGAAEEAELSENVVRADLTWQERTAAVARLAALKGREATAEAAFGDLNTGRQLVRQNEIVAKALVDPEVAKAKSFNDALKIVRKQEAARENARLAEVVGANFSRASHTLLQGDALAHLATLPAESFDVILTDPPYGMDAQNFGDANGKLQVTHTYDDSWGSVQALLEGFLIEATRLAKPQAHLYICCDIDRFHWLRAQAEALQWHVHRTPIIIYKTDGNRVPWPEHGPQRKWEMCLYAERGGRPTLRIAPDVVETRGDPNLGHGAQKPVALYTDLLSRSARPGDTVLDPFCGTGTVFPAAHTLRVRATGIEMSTEYAGIAAKRLQDLT
jgi:DNA modification methylase/ParB-like chromosome segregation protein Spo0J